MVSIALQLRIHFGPCYRHPGCVHLHYHKESGLWRVVNISAPDSINIPPEDLYPDGLSNGYSVSTVSYAQHVARLCDVLGEGHFKYRIFQEIEGVCSRACFVPKAVVKDYEDG